MQNYEIKSCRTNETLFAGEYESFNQCLEAAVTNRVTMPYADLRYKNLNNACLDDAILPHANFSHANLSGSNLSEAYLKGATFAGTALYNTCLSYSNLRACDFTGASFGATDIAGTIISGAQFSTLSCFSLDFTHVKQMDACVFMGSDGRFSTMSKPPIVIKGLNHAPIILTDHDVRNGHNTINTERSLAIAQKLSMREIRKRLNTGR